MPALTKLDNVKSTSRYTPPNGTAAWGRCAVNGARPLPGPPAITMPKTRCATIVYHPGATPGIRPLPVKAPASRQQQSFPVLPTGLPQRHGIVQRKVPDICPRRAGQALVRWAG
jgi:hypothetical protein